MSGSPPVRSPGRAITSRPRAWTWWSGGCSRPSGDGDGLVVRLARRIPVEPRFSLAAGLVVVLVVVGMLVTRRGSRP